MKRKIYYLAAAYMVFQFLGFSLTNLLLVLNQNIPSFGGLLHLATYLAMAFALSIEPKPALTYTPEATLAGRYNRFLNKLFDALPGGAFGEKYIKFSEFTEQTGLKEYISYVEARPFLQSDRGLDLIPIIDRTITYLRENNLLSLLDAYLPVINSTYSTLPLSEAQRLDALMLEHSEILMEADIFYGIDGGRLLQKVEIDKSLNNLPDTAAAIKIYKRILLAAFPELKSSIGSELIIRLLLYETLKDIEITPDGYISVNTCIEKNKHAQANKFIVVFNNFLLSILSTIVDTSPRTANLIIGKINRVLELNRHRASRLGVISTLRATLASSIPTHLTILPASKDLTEEDLKVSKKIIGENKQ